MPLKPWKFTGRLFLINRSGRPAAQERIPDSGNAPREEWTAGVKITLAKGFLLIFIAGSVLSALIAAGTERLPESLRLLRIFLGIPFVLLAPGFALQAALFPHPGELDPLARASFSFGLSIALTPMILIALNATGLGAQFEPIAVSLCLIILVCAGVMFIRLRRSPSETLSGAAGGADLRAWWTSQDRFSRRVYAVIALALAAAAVSGALVSQEAPAEPFTEFYLLDSQGLSLDYPREVTAGTQVMCILEIVNREGQTSQYRIVAVGGGSQALSSAGPISLADGETWQGYLTIVLDEPGDGQEVEFLLERDGSPWPYRTLRIWMNVNPAGIATSGAPAG
jgi:uncharacterized membrane protein